MTPYCKENSIPLQDLSLPENVLYKSSPATSPKLSSTPVTLFSIEPPGHQVPELTSQLWPHTHRKEDIFPSQYKVRDLWHIIENDPQLHSIWCNSPLHHCLLQNRIPSAHPSTFLPSQTNISTFCSKRIPSIITTDTLVICMRPCPSQTTHPGWHTPFGKGDLICRMGASTNLKPTYTSLPSRALWSSTPCSTHSFRVTKIGYLKPRGLRCKHWTY